MFRLSTQLPTFFLLAFFAAGPAGAAGDASNAGEEGAAVRQVVRDWASAWRGGKFNEYAAYYVSGYSGDYSSNSRWREERKKRIDGRKDIQLDLGPMLVEFSIDDASAARAVFLQSYRSANWCDVVEKTLGLKKTESGWRIDREESRLRNRC